MVLLADVEKLAATSSMTSQFVSIEEVAAGPRIQGEFSQRCGIGSSMQPAADLEVANGDELKQSSESTVRPLKNPFEDAGFFSRMIFEYVVHFCSLPFFTLSSVCFRFITPLLWTGYKTTLTTVIEGFPVISQR
jgi:hypothetical protein